MAQQTMSEKDQFLAAFEREYQTTLKLLKAFPPAQHELKPHERLKSARELAWMLVLNQQVLEMVIKGELKPGMPPAPSSWNEILPALEQAHRDIMGKLSKLRDEDLNAMIMMPIGPGPKMGEMRRGDVLWFFLHDTIHHRGQFSVYARMAGAKVPSIYGPSADEPWF